MDQAGVGVDLLRMDNADENKKLDECIHSREWKLPIKVEYTAQATPQQNAPVEVGFAVIGG